MKERVLNYMREFGSISTYVAFVDLGCTRLSEYIRQLRRDGYVIASNWTENVNRYGDKVKYVIYELKEER